MVAAEYAQLHLLQPLHAACVGQCAGQHGMGNTLAAEGRGDIHAPNFGLVRQLQRLVMLQPHGGNQLIVVPCADRPAVWAGANTLRHGIQWHVGLLFGG